MVISGCSSQWICFLSDDRTLAGKSGGICRELWNLAGKMYPSDAKHYARTVLKNI
jgi:hypothetical protein